MIIAPPGNGFEEMGDWVNTTVHLDGKICNNSIYADDVAGCIIVLKYDDAGQLLYESQIRIMLEVLHGTVLFVHAEK